MRRRMKLFKTAGILCLAICCVLSLQGFPTRASGLFDGLLVPTPEPEAGESAQGGGLFDDLLVPTPEPEAGESAQGGGLFDNLLASTPEPEAEESAQGGGLFDDLLSEAAVAGDFEEQIAELTALFGAAEILEEADQTIVRFDVSSFSMEEVFEGLNAAESLGFTAFAMEQGILTLTFSQRRDGAEGEETPAPTQTPNASQNVAGNSYCSYCGGSGMCEKCIGGSCWECNGTGEIWCESCFGSGNCQSCYGMGGEDRYTVGGGVRWVTCSRCGGSGICRRCGGMGAKTCGYCHGTGNCAYCDGTGDCPYCHGTGEK